MHEVSNDKTIYEQLKEEIIEMYELSKEELAYYQSKEDRVNTHEFYGIEFVSK